MAFIRKVKTASGATAVQIAHKSHGQMVRIDHIGSAHTDEDLKLLIELAQEQLHRGQPPLFDRPSSLKLSLGRTCSRLLWDVLMEEYCRLGFDQLGDEDFASLCLARIVEPVSKLDSLRVLDDLGVTNVSKDQLYRCLARVIAKNYRTTISALCFQQANQSGLRLVLYDVTTLYFEIQKEDDYRKPGMSKERRLEPQIVVGLLVDQYGFPLSVHSFIGNTAETTTILPVLQAFKQQHDLADITVVADAGMLSAKNLAAFVAAGYTYIVGCRLFKIPDDVAQYQKTKNLVDNQIITTKLDDGQRVIYQYREKRAALDKRNIQKQIARAEKIVNGTTVATKAKFLTVKTKDKCLNQALIAKANALAGIKGYVTNLDQPDTEIISAYHQLWNVEASFRMSKSDLRARPIFHHKRDSIEAHLTVVFAALAIARTIEYRTGMSIQQFVKTVRPIRSGIVRLNGLEYYAEAEIQEPIKNLIRKLRAGH
jgi:hypothetical protein